jgi:hypothetical protein
MIKLPGLALWAFLLAQTTVQAQDKSCYENLTFSEFLSAKVEDELEFIKAIYKAVKYPVSARKAEAQAIVEVLLINHGESGFEIIQVNYEHRFAAQVANIAGTIRPLGINWSDPFMTRFFIYFDIEPFRYNREAIEQYRWGLINDNMFIIHEYIVPDINHH